jgi:hypothetical protein
MQIIFLPKNDYVDLRFFSAPDCTPSSCLLQRTQFPASAHVRTITGLLHDLGIKLAVSNTDRCE